MYTNKTLFEPLKKSPIRTDKTPQGFTLYKSSATSADPQMQRFQTTSNAGY